MSESDSFSGKICISCSKSSFILKDTKLAYSSSGSSIQYDTFVCPNCRLVIELHSVIQESSMPKPETIVTLGNPLTNLSVEQSSNPLKVSTLI
jgi:hypothetical protein